MACSDLFIDIERFVQWTYNHSNLFGNDENSKFSETTCKNWRSYSKFPSLHNLDIINNNYIDSSTEKIFHTIIISKLIICINNAKDHNRGKNSSLLCLSSTEKKILIILLLGRFLDDANANCFTAQASNHSALYDYLVQINPSSNQGATIKKFKYFPGRTFSYQQLCKMSSNYKNGITTQGINVGLKHLLNTGLISCIDYNNDLYRLEFDACYNFLNSCKKDT